MDRKTSSLTLKWPFLRYCLQMYSNEYVTGFIKPFPSRIKEHLQVPVLFSLAAWRAVRAAVVQIVISPFEDFRSAAKTLLTVWCLHEATVLLADYLISVVCLIRSPREGYQSSRLCCSYCKYFNTFRGPRQMEGRRRTSKKLNRSHWAVLWFWCLCGAYLLRLGFLSNYF